MRQRLEMAVSWVLAASAAAANGGTEPVEIDTVFTTATRRTATTHDVSVSVSTITPEEMAGTAPLTVVDYFRGEPGTYIQQTTPGQANVIIRGLKGSEILHLVDGFRLNHAIFRNAPNQYIALLDPWTLERIEAVRGPMSVLYGADAMGGIIQFKTRSPRFESDELRARAKLAMQTSTADSSFSSQIEGEIGTNRWVGHAALSWLDAGRVRTGSGDHLPFTDFSAFGANASLLFLASPRDELKLQVQLARQPDTSRYDALVPGFGQSEPDSVELRFKPQDREFVQVVWRHSNSWADEMTLQVGQQHIDDDRVSRDLDSPYREFEQNSSTLSGFVGNFQKTFAAHSTAFGFELYRDVVDSVREREDAATGIRTARPSRFPDGSTMKWAGFYFSDDWRAAERWHLSAGTRYTQVRVKISSTLGEPGLQLDLDNISSTAGVVFEASDELNLVANVGQGFRPPNVFDLGTFGARGNRFSIPNPQLAPERVESVDLGFKYDGSRWHADMSVFAARYRDKITQMLTGELDAQGRFIVQSQNATRLDLWGIEASASMQLGRALLSASATWLRGEESFDAQTYPADRIPPAFGSVSVECPMHSGANLEIYVDWASAQDRLSPRDRIDPRINPRGTSGWAAVGIRSHWRYSERVRASLGIENLFDRSYREHGSGFDAPGRGLYASFEYRL